jgi:Holliday junction resolvasome RuvABC endonuclease subunit
MPRFMAIDPSTTVTGWAIFQDEGLVAWGKIDTRKVAYSFRFQFIVNELIHLVQTYDFQEVAIEDVSFAWHSKNRNRNIAGLQSVFRSIKDWSESVNLTFSAHNPATWKNAVVGAYAAPKEITKNNIRLRFQGVPDDLTDHEYDAIAIGVYHGALAKWGSS